MKITLQLAPELITVALFAAIAGSATSQEYPARYRGGEASLATVPNGAVVNARVLEPMPENVYFEKTLEEVTDGVWVIGGYSTANCTVIEAPEGLIVYDTGDFGEEGKHFREAPRGVPLGGR